MHYSSSLLLVWLHILILWISRSIVSLDFWGFGVSILGGHVLEKEVIDLSEKA